MSEYTLNKTIKDTEFVPPELWGRDHWSTLAYIETKLVDGPYKVCFDPHMRQGRRHYRVLLGKPNGRKTPANAMVMRPEYGSRLADGTYLPWHDDWHCVQDMVKAGLFEDGVWDVGFKLKLTDLGSMVTAALRKLKSEGGSFSTCNGELLPLVAA